jgi:methionine-gamma-lyase
MSHFLEEVRLACATAASFDEASARAVRLLRKLPGYDWVGIYMVEGDELVLGAWDGPAPTEHVRIPLGRGICGAAAAANETIIVEDVNADPRYLSCFVRTRSEIVVPISVGGHAVGEIDVDGDRVGQFGPMDRHVCEAVAAELGRAFERERRVRRRGEATIGVVAGEEGGPPARPVHAPLFDAIAYEFDGAAALERYLEDESRGFIYARWSSPTVRGVEEKLARLMGAEAVRLFASGMGAVAATALALAGRGRRVVHVGPLYGGTHHLFHEVLSRFGVAVEAVAPGDAAGLARALAPDREGGAAAFLYAETIANPTLRVADLGVLAAAAGGAGIPLVVDNTFATPYVCRPLAHGATLVIESATKALGGHGDLMAGVVAGPRALVERIDRGTGRYLGATAGAHDAHLLARGLRTFALRAERQCATATAVAAALAEDARVGAVSYPGLPSHPDHALARRQFEGGASGEGRFGSVVAFDLGSLARARAFFDAVELFRRAASLGSVESLVSLPLLSSHHGIPAEQLAAHGISPGLVRLSIGVEDAADLLADLGRAIAIASRAPDA